MRKALFFLILVLGLSVFSQNEPVETQQDSTAQQKKVSPFSTGFYPLGFFDADFKYLVKYNNYEGLRLGFGGVTNKRLSEKHKISGYVARGFIDEIS